MAEEEREKLIGEYYNVKHKKQLGVLLLTSLRVAWAPGEMVQTFQVDYPYQQIKAQRISAETSSKVQLQLVLHTGAHVNFHFTGSNATQQRQQVKGHLAQALSKSSSVPISAELEAKNQLLKSNPSLYQLYKDLVTTGLISAEEFWANQAHTKPTNNSADSAHPQESGIPSAFLADVQAVYDGCNAVRYNLSADVIQAIFKTYPIVRKKHAEMVPQQLKEEEFWTQFFQSQFFHHGSEGHKFVDCLSHDQKKGGSPSVDISLPETAGSILGEEGYSVIPENHNFNTPPSLVQRCNHHSSRVLEALMEGSTESTSPAKATPTSSSQPHMQLVGSQRAQLQSSMASAAALLPLTHTLSSWQLKQDIQPNTVHSAIPHLAPGGLLMSSGCGQKASLLLTVEQQQQVFRHQAAIAELLRHFWSCFPARTAQLEVKAHKMHQCLLDYSEKQLSELEEVLDNTDSLRIVQHLRECIARAGQHHLKWTTKKKNSHRLT